MYDEERKYETAKPLSEAERASIWEMSSGLQAADNLKTSDYCDSVGEKYITGEYTSDEAVKDLENHYQGEKSRQKEAEIVTARIVKLVESRKGTAFRLEPQTLLVIHKRLFAGQLEQESWEGKWRTENISKPEPVLGGRSAKYADAGEILYYLENDLGEERKYRYKRSFDRADIKHLSTFVTKIWETHPFREGNTRTTAVFAQLYLNSLGFKVDNSLFAENGKWFRDALVRASYTEMSEGIENDDSFLCMFFENLLCGANHDLPNIDLNRHGIRVNEDIPYRTPDEYKKEKAVKQVRVPNERPRTEPLRVASDVKRVSAAPKKTTLKEDLQRFHNHLT